MISFRVWAGLTMSALVGCSGAAFTAGGLGDSGADGGVRDDAGHDSGPVTDSGRAVDGGGGTDGSVADSAPEAAGDAGCVTSTIDFVMRAAQGSTKTYCAGGTASCMADWLSIRPLASGSASMVIDAPCLTQCDVCQPVACSALCAAPTPVPAEGEKRVWDGTYYASGTCGASLSCFSPACAAPGRYVATMCASARLVADAALAVCLGSSAQTCVDVAFDWPPADAGLVVTGTIGDTTSADGG